MNNPRYRTHREGTRENPPKDTWTPRTEASHTVLYGKTWDWPRVGKDQPDVQTQKYANAHETEHKPQRRHNPREHPRRGRREGPELVHNPSPDHGTQVRALSRAIWDTEYRRATG